MSTFMPGSILSVDGRWVHDGVDVTDRLVWWWCALGHSWQASRTDPGDAGCAVAHLRAGGDEPTT